MASDDQNSETRGKKERVESAGQSSLSEADIAAIATQVAKRFRTKEFRAIGNSLAKSLEPKDLLSVGKGLGKSPRILVIAVIGIIAACVISYNAVPHFVKEKAQTVFNAEITNQVKLQFQVPHISNIVVAVATSEAMNMMQKQISPEIAKFQIALSQVMSDFTTNLFEMSQTEEFDWADTNRVSSVVANTYHVVVLRLANAAIKNSLHGWCYSRDFAAFPILALTSTRNAVCFSIDVDPKSFSTAHFTIGYVRDIRETNLVRKVEFRGIQVYLDGVHSFPVIPKSP